MTSELSNDEVTDNGKVRVIEEPEKIQIMLEETRRSILAVLGTGIEENEAVKRFSMSVAEITQQLNALHPMAEGKQLFKQTAIYHHVEILKDAGFIKIDQSLSGVTTFYCRTAPVFVGSTVLASTLDILNNEEPISERLNQKAQKLLKTFELTGLEPSKKKDFEILLNLYQKKKTSLHENIAKDIKHIDNENALDLYKFIWFFWACSDSEMVGIAKRVKDFLLNSKI